MEKTYHETEGAGARASLPAELRQALHAGLRARMGRWHEEAKQLLARTLQHMTGAMVESLLWLSAEEVAGPRSQGRPRGEVLWHGRQPGRVWLGQGAQVRVQRPRLRTRAGREVEIPAYAALQQRTEAQRRMLDVVLRGVSSRNYSAMLPAMAEVAGISRSNVSREVMQAAEARLGELMARRLDGLPLCVVYVDGMVYGQHHVIGAVGVDVQGYKHVLGVQDGATENAAAVKDLLQGLVARGLDPAARLLFVIDGAKALRTAIAQVFGNDHPVQRCRVHKIRNVTERLPRHLRPDTAAAMRAAYRLSAVEGEHRLRHLAHSLASSHPAAGASLLEGLEECFTINRLHLPAALHRCLASTNLIESPHSGVRMRVRRVTRWRSGAMALRWAASAFLVTEAHFQRLCGYRDLPTLAAILRPPAGAARQGVA